MYIFTLFSLTVLSAVLFALGIPNELLYFGSSVLGLISLIPLYYAFVLSKNRKRSAVCFGLWVALVHVLSSFWLGFFRDFAIFTLGVSSVAYFILTLCFGPLFYEVVRLRNKRMRPLFFAVVWVFWEWFKSNGFLAYPWGTIPMTAFRSEWVKQIADITGVWGISFVIALFSSSLAIILPSIFHVVENTIQVKKINFASILFGVKTKAETSIFAFCLVVFCFCAGYSMYHLNRPLVPVDNLKVAIVQANSNSWEVEFNEQLAHSINLTESLLNHSEKPDLILWHEGILHYTFPLSLPYYFLYPEKYTFSEFLKKNNIPLLAGTALPMNMDTQNSSNDLHFFANSVCLISPDCEILDWYSKIHLVPFAEYMPLIEKEWVRNIFSSLVGFSSAYIPGNEYKLITLTKQNGKTIHFSTPICFEDAFSSLCAHLHNLGSELIINLTDDSWSHTKSAEYQHFVVASYRSIELRTTLIRSTNSGYSCIVNPKGIVTDDLPLFTEAGLYADVPIYPYQITFYARFKDWLPSMCYLIIIGFIIIKPLKVKKTYFLETTDKKESH